VASYPFPRTPLKNQVVLVKSILFRLMLFLGLAFGLLSCTGQEAAGPVLVLAGGSGPEEEHVQKQLAAFHRAHPDIRVVYQSTPSSASARHTLFVTWLSSRSAEVDVLNLDVIWIPEFAAAGWILPLDDFLSNESLPCQDFLPAGLACSRYREKLYALPWYVDAGLLYYRQDLYDALGLSPPRTFSDLQKLRGLQARFGLPYGFLFQGQAYEGLVCVVLEFLWGNGGEVFDDEGRLVLDSPRNREALALLVDLIYRQGVSPLAVTTFLEEDCRYAFQEGYAALMRNWPYAFALMNQPDSPVRGKFAVLPPLHGHQGQPVAVFGGGALAINAFSRHPQEAMKLMRFLMEPQNLRDRALALGMLPPLKSLYSDPALVARFPYLTHLKEVFFTARPRPITPLYSFISDILRLHFSRALTQQETPEEALRRGQAEISDILARYQPQGGPR
jgi:multiple sugar transport system substrate-binding protein